MHAIRKKIVTDEDSRPVAVQIDYEDWLEIERLLERRGTEEPEAGKSRYQELLESRETDEKPADDRQDEFEAVADELADSWKGGDGLEYQIRIREEWDDR